MHQLDAVLSPLLKNGQSIHHVMANNADRIPRCSKTIYRYALSHVCIARHQVDVVCTGDVA